MALSILDGNQSATTLSTIVTSGQHIPAHTVVSLGTQAKTDIFSAISNGISVAVGGNVSVSNISSVFDSNDQVVIRGLACGYDYGTNLAVPIGINGQSLLISGSAAVTGVVTANSSNGALTTRFGSISTANTSFATTAVTNT